MESFKANERTFQGILISLVNKLIANNNELLFERAVQELEVGVEQTRFNDFTLFSAKDTGIKVFCELKNSNWDATDEILVKDAMKKAFDRGVEFFVTGTPRQLVIFQTFKPNTTINDRKLKIYYLSNIKRDNEVISSVYENQISPVVLQFLKDLSDIVHGIKEVKWDSIDKLFITKLSAYILEASAEMSEVMIPKIKHDESLRKRIRQYLTEEDIFNVSLNFTNEDIYNLCQLANYLLYLKIIFYSYLQRDVKELKLKPLQIPEEREKLNKELRERFNDVLKYDYESIFEPNVLDRFEYSEKYIPQLKRNVEQIKSLKFKDINCDIIGAIYNTLIDNQEQHHRGQHFTNTNEVDIVNAFCINKDTKLVFDSGCGAGTFLVRAYAFMKYFNKKLKHEVLIERLWGVEIAPFPTFLATMNLALLDLKAKENYPVIIEKDFSLVKRNSEHNLIFFNFNKFFKTKQQEEKHSKVTIPSFDACIGNPPYIRQELIENKDTWGNLALLEYGLKRINKQSDLYVYYLMHTAAFLKEGGRLGYVISGSWLDVEFGTGFQKFILDNFKIIAVIDNQKVRSFETASVNTIILILEKCSINDERANNIVRFVRVYKDYSEIIGNNDNQTRIDSVKKFTSEIESLTETTNTEDYLLTAVKQSELEKESSIDGEYKNGYWGTKYLRSSPIYTKIIAAAKDKLIPLSHIAEVRRGFTTGSNDFFYVKDETNQIKKMTDEEYKLTFGVEREKHKISWEKYGWFYSELTKQHHLLERFYFKPLFKSQKEASNLDVDVKKLKYHVLICNEPIAALRKVKAKLVKYIEEGERAGLHLRPTNAARVSEESGREWFNLGEELFIGDFIFPSKIGERFRLIDNRKSKVFCDKVNYNLKLKDEYKNYADVLFLILNSTLFRYLIDLFSRQMVVKVSDVDVMVVERTLIINPKILKPHLKELKKLCKQLKSREQLQLQHEIKKTDRFSLDEIIFSEIGLFKKDVKELHYEAVKYVEDRKLKSESLDTKKIKTVLDSETTLKLVKERFPEINSYSEMLKGMNTDKYTIPNLPVKFPKNLSTVDTNLFASYKLYFKEGNKEIVLSLRSNSQIKLIKYFYDELEMKGVSVEVPKQTEDCEKIYKQLLYDYTNYGTQVKEMLKKHRSKTTFQNVWKRMIME